MTLGVRYCGGCNSRYDRVAAVNRLKTMLPEWEVVTASPGADMDAVLVVSGCATRCTNTSDLALPADRLIDIAGFEDILPARDKLRSLAEKKDAAALSKKEIERLLPHRAPMLFLDEVTDLTPGVEITAFFTPGKSHPVFAGHFPGMPVFPGVLAIEAMAQAADVMLYATGAYEGKLPYLFSVEKATFRKGVSPGDEMKIKAVKMGERPEMGVVICKCTVSVGEAHVADAEIYLAMR